MSPEKKERASLKSPQFARRFAGYFLDRLGVGQKTPVQLAVDDENEMIDVRHQAFFHANLFRAIQPDTPENNELLQKLKEEFEAELDERVTMADRFSLFADEFYAAHIHTLDLGETKKPGCHDEVASLKAEYQDLLENLVEDGIIDGEFSRNEAKPTIHFRFPATSEFAVATRNRELLSFVDGERTVSVAKRMTFLMPITATESLKISKAGALDRRGVRKVEALIDAQDAESIVPVRTVYYAKSKPLPKPKG